MRPDTHTVNGDAFSLVVGSGGDTQFTEEELVDHVAYIQRRQDAVSNKSAANGSAKKGAGSGAHSPSVRR